MILGLSVDAFTTLHTIISLVAIGAGLMALGAMLQGRFPAGLTAVFLVTTIATSVTGFFFHSAAFGPPHAVGVVSLVILAVTLLAYYTRKLAGRWKSIYIGTAVAALYFNCFVLVVQAFAKFPTFKALAPTQTEPPFAMVQGLNLALFVALGWLAVKRQKTA